MKDVIYLVVNANQVVRMTKTLPSLKRGEVPIKVSVSVDDNAFSTPTISREVIVTDWQKDVRLNDLELRQNFITEEEVEMIGEPSARENAGDIIKQWLYSCSQFGRRCQLNH